MADLSGLNDIFGTENKATGSKGSASTSVSKKSNVSSLDNIFADEPKTAKQVQVEKQSTPAPTPEKPSLLSRIGNSLTNFLEGSDQYDVKQAAPRQANETKDQYLTRANAENAAESARIKNLTSARNLFGVDYKTFTESLPFGIGTAIKQIRQDPVTAASLTGSDFLKATPQAVLEAGKGFIKAPISGALNVLGIGGKQISFNIPLLGEVSNSQFKAAQRVANGEDPTTVILEEGSNAILDTLFFVDLATRPFTPRTNTVAKMDAEQTAAMGKKGTIGTGEVPANAVPKTGRLYQKPTITTPTFTKLNPEAIDLMQKQGVDLSKYDASKPTFFRFEMDPKGNITGEVVQVKPSVFDSILGKIKGKKGIEVSPIAETGSNQAPNQAETPQNGEIVPQTVDSSSIAPNASLNAELAKLPPESFDVLHTKTVPVASLANIKPVITDTPASFNANNVDTSKLDLPSAEVQSHLDKLEAEYQKTQDPKIADEIGAVRSGLVQFQEAAKETKFAVQLNGGNVAHIDTFEYSDGKFSPRVIAATPNYGIGTSFKSSNTYPTEAEAIVAGKKELIEWAKKQLTTAEGKDKSVLENIIKHAENPDIRKGEISKAVIGDIEKEISDIYQSAGQSETLPEFTKAEEVLSTILQQLDLSEAGYRLQNPQTGEFSGVPSTFPKWIPEELRSKELFDKVYGRLDLKNLKMPEGNKSKQRALYNILLNEVDAQLGVDTSGLRDELTQIYETKNNNRGGDTKSDNRSATGSEKPTQREVVKKSVAGEAKSIKEIAKETGIKEPNVRRILGVGAKEGTFERVDNGVYILSKGGQDIAWVETGNAVESLPRLAKDGFKADMVFLDIPYDTPAVKGGNRGVKYDLLSVADFSKILDAVSDIARTDNAPVIHMYSQAESGIKAMQKYNDLFIEKGFKPVGKGQYQKTFEDGSPVTSPNGKVAKPEGILVFTKSGKLDKDLKDLNFTLKRPKGYQTEKPAEMLKAMIEMTTNEGDTVLDPFAGSGVTGAEAVRAGRKAYLIERNAEVAKNITSPRVKNVLPSTKIKTAAKEKPQFNAGDVVIITDKATGKSSERLVKNMLPDGSGVATMDENVQIPYKSLFSKFDITLKTKAPENYIQKKTGFTFGEMDRIEEAEKKLGLKYNDLIHEKGAIKEKINALESEGVKGDISDYQTPKGAKLKKLRTDLNYTELAIGQITQEAKIGVENALSDLPAYQHGAKNASIGVFADGTPIEEGHLDKIKPFEMPELVRLARELTGEIPKVKTKIMRMFGGQVRGVFRSDTGKIELNADIFSDPEGAAKTLAHEIGHLVDWIPDKIMARGNLLGRLLSLKKFTKSVFGQEEGIFGKEALDLKQIRNDAFRAVLRENNVKYAEYITRKEIRDLLKEKIKAKYTEMVDAKNGVRNSKVKAELQALSEYWKPYDKVKSSPSYVAYRNKSDELYADAISVLLNSPGTLEKMAPTFYKEFFDNLDKKPEVKAAFFELQELLNGSSEKIFAARKEDIRKGFERAEDLQAGFADKKEAGKKAYWERLRQQLDDINYPILKKQAEAEANGTVLPEADNPKFILQEQSLADNENFVMVDEIDQNIVKPIEKAGMSVQDIGEYLLLDRIQKDRADIANPFGFNPTNAAKQMQFLKDSVGEKNFELLKEKVQIFHDIVFKSVEEAVKVGSYNKDTFETRIKPNKDSYASFQVVDYMQDYVPATVKGQVGTLKEVANPFVSTILKTIALNRLNAFQRAKNATIKLLKENFSDEIAPTKKITTDGKLSVFKPARDKGQIELLEDGKMQSYDVDPYIAESFKRDKVGDLNAIVALVDTFNNKLFKPIVTTYNLGFAAAFNPIRDFKRNYKLIPNATVANLLTEYVKSLPSAVRYSKGKMDEFTKSLVESKAINAPVNEYNFDPREDELGRILQKYGLIKDTEKPLFNNKTAENVRKTVLKPVAQTLEGIRFIANTFEIVSKIAGAKVRMKGGEAGKQLAYNLRNFTGTPNYKVRGKQTSTTNAIFVFSNIMKEGLKSDFRFATDPKTRSGYWWKTVKIDLLPKFLMFLASAGLLGATLKKFYDNVSEYDKTNYLIIPLGTTDDGKSVYMRIPHDETGRLISAAFWKIANMATDGGKGKDLQDIFALGAGQLPSVSPLIGTLSGWIQYLSGKNPYDAFRGRNVIDDTTWTAGGGAALKKMVQWTSNELGFSKFSTFDTSKQTGVETFMQVAPWFSSLIKISNYGQQEKLKEIGAEQKQKEAQKTLDERAIIDKYVKQANSDKSTMFAVTKYKNQLIKEVIGHAPTNKEEADHADSLVRKLTVALKKGLNDDPRVTELLYATTNAQKKEILKSIKSDLTDKEFTDLKASIIKNKIVSPALFFNLK